MNGKRGKVHELFCKRVMGMPNTAANRKEKMMERVLRYCQRLWKMDETSLLGDALKTQSFKKGKCMERSEQKVCGY
jgi:hypothetical protein